MSLEPLVLDDLGFDEMVASVRGRIPAASAGLWTHHAPTDPGITLLELFAWLIEQRLYWLDQVPEELARALVALLGEAPRPPRPATTVLALDGAPFEGVAGGVPFRLLDPDRPRSFTTRQALTLLPLARVGLATAEGDRGAPLAHGAGVPLLPAGGGPAEATIVLWLAAPLPSPRPPDPVALLFELAPAPGVEPEWSPDAVKDVRTPAEIAWLHGTGPGGSPAPFPAGVEDGTGGLRRSGVLRLPLPDAWLPGPPAPDGALPYTLVLRTDAATFTSPPLLRRLTANAVAAEHSKAVAVPPADLAAAARRWLKLPGQVLPLPAEAPPALPPTAALRLRERGGWRDWMPVADFAFHGPEARVFRVDRAAAALRFGDGLTGRIPVPHDPAAPELELRYQGGGGTEGNLGAGRDWESEPAGLALTARNPVPAAGGEEAEAVSVAAGRFAAGLVGGERAVLASDYEELARTTPGVAIARAHAAVGHHPLHPCARVPGVVTVFVVPWAPWPAARDWDGLLAHLPGSLVPGPVTDPGALAAVSARLEERRLVGVEVFVRTARYRPVALAVTVAADPLDTAGLEARVAGELARFLDPLAGGSGDGWPFGEPVRPSALVRRAQQAVGREGEVLAVAIGLDGQEPGQSCRDVAIGPFDLVYLERIRVRWERAGAAAGGLP